MTRSFALFLAVTVSVTGLLVAFLGHFPVSLSIGAVVGIAFSIWSEL